MEIKLGHAINGTYIDHKIGTELLCKSININYHMKALRTAMSLAGAREQKLKRKVFCEKNKCSILALRQMQRGQVASVLNISMTVVHKGKLKQQTLGSTKLQICRWWKGLSTHWDECHVLQMLLNNHRITSQRWSTKRIANGDGSWG